MSWTPGYGLDGSIGLHVGYREPIAVRVHNGGGAYLSIGDNVEIVLAQTHVAALHEQSGTVLADLVALEKAKDNAGEAWAIGEQAARSADYARRQADRAMAAGATRQAQEARAAADKAADASMLVDNAVQAVFAAMEIAGQALDEAGDTAAAAARAADETAAEDTAGQAG